ncbi:MAG: M28 family metallopeptidase [Pyrinomonadaceae bacterium]
MRLQIYRTQTAARAGGDEPPGAGAWARFGEETLLLSDDAETPATRAPGRAAPELERRVDATPDELYVVVQNGRLFQQHNPDVPVVHDRGRYLLVKLNPPRAQKLASSHPTCFTVLPLAGNEVAFESRAAAAAPRRAPASFVRDAVNRLERASLEAALTKLVSFRTRHSTSTDFSRAATWARQQLNRMNFQTRTQTVPLDGGGNSRNVIADKAGAGGGARRLVLVTAHLDSINLEDGPAAPAPGADDNASGSAGLLEIARALSGFRNEHDLRFVLFGGEEQGLFGSTRHVAGLTPAERARISAVVNMDMIGTLNTQRRSFLVEGAPVSRAVIEKVAAAAAAFTQLAVETSLKAANSDHVPFIRAGLPAVLAIEGADNTNDAVHSARDVPARINFDYSLEILRAVTGFVADELGEAA